MVVARAVGNMFVAVEAAGAPPAAAYFHWRLRLKPYWACAVVFFYNGGGTQEKQEVLADSGEEMIQLCSIYDITTDSPAAKLTPRAPLTSFTALTTFTPPTSFTLSTLLHSCLSLEVLHSLCSET